MQRAYIHTWCIYYSVWKSEVQWTLSSKQMYEKKMKKAQEQRAAYTVFKADLSTVPIHDVYELYMNQSSPGTGLQLMAINQDQYTTTIYNIQFTTTLQLPPIPYLQ